MTRGAIFFIAGALVGMVTTGTALWLFLLGWVNVVPPAPTPAPVSNQSTNVLE